MDKTIIYTHSKKQADKFYKILNEKRDLKGKVLLSHSENDPDSIEFNKFKTDENYHILIAVDRGRIGFDMPNLRYIIDFTMTQNLDMLLQMYGRLLRTSKQVKNKTYYKVATKNTADYFVDLMTAMLCLTSMEWYSKFNGKNMGGIRIPKVITKSIRNKNYQQSTNKNKTNKVKPYVSLTELGIPLDLNFFRQSILHTSNGKFNTIAETTLDDVRREMFEIKAHNQFTRNFLSYDEAKKYVKQNDIETLTQYYDLYKNKKLPEFLPAAPEQVYRNEWKGYSEFFDNKYRSSEILSFDECKKFIKNKKINNLKDWQVFSKTKRPKNIPSNPQRTFKKQWKGWKDFLGTA
jgi:superfamily II DNA/RNA helicase